MILFPNGLKPVTVTLYQNIPFDNKYEHHLFRDVEYTDKLGSLGIITMKDFCEMRDENALTVFPKYRIVENLNFDYGNGLVTRVILTVPSYFTSSNYMIVENGCDTLYFFITDVTIKTSDESTVTAQYDLELDVLATYGMQFSNAVDKVPLFTERKHCQRFSVASENNPNLPYCSDFVTSEESTASCNPKVIKDVYKNYIDYETPSVADLLWVYIYTGKYTPTGSLVEHATGSVNGIGVPYAITVFPLCHEFNVKLPNDNGYEQYFVNDIINDIYDNADTYSIKISPMPPFNSLKTNTTIAGTTYTGDNELEVYTSNNGRKIVTLNVVDSCIEVNGQLGYTYFIGDSVLEIIKTTNFNPFVLMSQKVGRVKYHSNVNLIDGGEFHPSYAPTINDKKDVFYESKMLFYPCRKYELYQRYGSPVEVHPELVASIEKFTGDYELETFSTSSIQSTQTSTYIKFNPESNNFNDFYTKVNKGLVNNCNYSLPCGTDALKTFTETQGASYAVQSVGKVVGSILSIVGGGALMASGNPMGAIGVAGGIASGVTAIGGAVAKYEDLSNTPDKISNNGTSLFDDVNITQYIEDGNLNPKLVVNELTPSEKEIILDYFYHYGYNVQRTCNFTKNLTCEENGYSESNWVDKRLLTRTLFNYVKLNENMRNKVINIYPSKGYGDSIIPPIIVDKLTSIFNNGVTLWTLFNVRNKTELRSDRIEKYLLKDEYENAEIDL